MEPRTIIQARITCQKILLIKLFWINKEKAKLFLVNRPPMWLKIWFLFLVFIKGQKRDINEFVTKFVGIIVTFIFIWNLSQIPCKIFPTQCFLTDHLKHWTLNKTTCRVPSADPCQLCLLYISWGALQLLWLLFEAFRTSWFIWQRIFDHF